MKGDEVKMFSISVVADRLKTFEKMGYETLNNLRSHYVMLSLRTNMGYMVTISVTYVELINPDIICYVVNWFNTRIKEDR